MMVNTPTNINKANDNFSFNSLNIKKATHITLEIQILAWDKYKKYGGVKPVSGIPILIYCLLG